jgi:hypothetical protein
MQTIGVGCIVNRCKLCVGISIRYRVHASLVLGTGMGTGTQSLVLGTGMGTGTQSLVLGTGMGTGTQSLVLGTGTG